MIESYIFFILIAVILYDGCDIMDRTIEYYSNYSSYNNLNGYSLKETFLRSNTYALFEEFAFILRLGRCLPEAFDSS